MDDYFKQSLAKLEWFEGSIPWMYRDTAGRVRVGVGVMLANAAAAQALPFQMGERAATADEIAAEFCRVDLLPMGRPALFYRGLDGPGLEKPEIDALLAKVLRKFEGEIKARLSGYGAMPDGVKMALLDMAFNLAPEGLLRDYPTLIRAVEAGAWAQAAGASFRHGPGAARNQWTRRMFLEGVAGGIKAEGWVGQICYGLVGLGAALVGWVNKRRKGYVAA